MIKLMSCDHVAPPLAVRYPTLQPVTGESFTYSTANVQEGAKLDISANSVWGGRYEKTFLDVRVFNPHAPSTVTACYKMHEKGKKEEL